MNLARFWRAAGAAVAMLANKCFYSSRWLARVWGRGRMGRFFTFYELLLTPCCALF